MTPHAFAAAYRGASPVGIAILAAGSLAAAYTASYLLPALWRNKLTRRALGAGISAAVASLAQDFDDID